MQILLVPDESGDGFWIPYMHDKVFSKLLLFDDMEVNHTHINFTKHTDSQVFLGMGVHVQAVDARLLSLPWTEASGQWPLKALGCANSLK